MSREERPEAGPGGKTADNDVRQAVTPPRGQLPGCLVHSLNNTLQSILGNVELARMQAPDVIRPFLEHALVACAEATRLVKDLLLAGEQARAPNETSSVPTHEIPGQQTGGSAAGPVVLVVDDDDIVRDSVARVLRFGGFCTFTAADGPAALAFVTRAAPAPALVLMDESMPGLDGTTVRKQINKLAPEIRVIMISGHVSEGLAGHGVHSVLEKPVRAEELLEVVCKTLGVTRTRS